MNDDASKSGETQERIPERMPVILRECERWLVLDKPAGWHTVARRGVIDDDAEAASLAAPGPSDAPPPRNAETEVAAAREMKGGIPSGRAQTIEEWLRATHPSLAALDECGLVHRLDLGTSGCLLVAKSAEELASLRREIGAVTGRIRKTYLAIVRRGIPPEGSFRFFFRGRHKRSAKVLVAGSGEHSECGRCRWTRLSSSREGDLVEVELLGPGRRHQIRAGLAHLRFPLRGDPLYRGDPALPGVPFPALHAWKLEIDGTPVEAPLPEPWLHAHPAIWRRTGGVTRNTPTSAG